LFELAQYFAHSYGVSAYNAEELREHGFHDPGILPIAVDPRKWNFPADPALLAALGDGKTNILFVGRIAPNKKQDDLVTAFHQYLAFDPKSRLILVGKAEQNDPYAAHVQEVIRALGLQESVFMPGSITDAQLAACYRTADLFWSMSEHEGFCVPLIEAMWFDVPVFAYRSSAVSETLAQSGLLFTTKEDFFELAATAHLLVEPGSLREKVIAQQRLRRDGYLPDKVEKLLEEMVTNLLADNSAPATAPVTLSHRQQQLA
jgi:glycosyltransferase involved in cell wall biosynthesis